MGNLSCDVLILGSGSAGLRAAISVREAGLEACVISKGPPGKSTCTWLSAGVIAGSANAASGNAHLNNTLIAGRGINQRDLVEVLIQEAPGRLHEMRRWGINADFRGGYLFSRGRPPVLGSEIIRCLIKKNLELGTQFMGNAAVTNLFMENGSGAVSAYHESSGEWIVISARAVILATGGAAALYYRHDNPKRMIGDGYRLALEAGAVLQDMEFVQFYPLCLSGAGVPPIVIPPKLADQGRLVNDQGENILDKYGVQERPAAERARDRLSQALFNEIYRNGRKVLLDLQDLSEDQWRKDPFSESMEHIIGDRYGAKIGPVHIAPVAHHTMGGVKISSTCATSIPGLFAAGEVVGGLHGANRMGGNALSETLVFGARAGNSAADWAKGACDCTGQALLKQLRERKTNERGPRIALPKLQEKLRKIMWEDGGIIRNAKGLIQAQDVVKQIYEEALGSVSISHVDNVADATELCSAARVAHLILQGAIKRQESRGAHLREDFPEQDDENWRGHLQVRNDNGADVWTFELERSAD